MGIPPLVSVLMPVRDAAETVTRAIASIRAQTWGDWELVAVDDGSRDATTDLLATIAREEPRVRVVTRPREGIVAALNAGLEEARGELIARMDADDEAYPSRLDAQVAFLRAAEHRSIGAVGCRVDFGGDRSAGAGYARHVDWLNSLGTPEEIALQRFVDAPVAHPSVMFRRAVVRQHGGYRAGEFPEDYELWLRWIDAGVRVGKVPEVLLRWNDRPGRASRTDTRYAPEAFYRLKAGYLARELERSGAGREVWVWGAGRPTRKRAEELAACGVRIAGYVDVDRKKWTRALGGTGRPVVGVDELTAAGSVFVLGYVSVPGAREFIRGELEQRGFREGRDFLLCA